MNHGWRQKKWNRSGPRTVTRGPRIQLSTPSRTSNGERSNQEAARVLLVVRCFESDGVHHISRRYGPERCHTRRFY